MKEQRSWRPPSPQDEQACWGWHQRCTDGTKGRRDRLHELLLALIAQQDDLELMDSEGPAGFSMGSSSEGPADAARWLERNRRVLQRYQSLVRTAVTLDALVDAEEAPGKEVP